MGDMGEMYKDWDIKKKEKKSQNKCQSTEMVMKQDFESVYSHNFGSHLVIRNNGKTADFWPSTGKYNIRSESNYKRGVKNLIKDLSK